MTDVTGPQVVDASVLVAAFLDSGADGEWALASLAARPLLSPQLMPFEVANILRRHLLRGIIDASEGRAALHDLERLPVELIPCVPLATRMWDLRDNLTAYDAAYVAAAELIDAPLLTLDLRIRRAPGVRCPVLTPP